MSALPENFHADYSTNISGKGVVRNYAKTIEWYTKAADQNDAKTIKWFTKAAEQNNADAQYNVDLMYGKGWGVKQKYAKVLE